MPRGPGLVWGALFLLSAAVMRGTGVRPPCLTTKPPASPRAVVTQWDEPQTSGLKPRSALPPSPGVPAAWFLLHHPPPRLLRLLEGSVSKLGSIWRPWGVEAQQKDPRGGGGCSPAPHEQPPQLSLVVGSIAPVGERPLLRAPDGGALSACSLRVGAWVPGGRGPPWRPRPSSPLAATPQAARLLPSPFPGPASPGVCPAAALVPGWHPSPLPSSWCGDRGAGSPGT